MAHMLDTTTGTAACYSLRNNPWHRLGVVVNAPVADPQVLTLAGLDWTVSVRDAFTLDNDGNALAIPHCRAVVRSDSNVALGAVGDRYQPFQNAQMLNFFRQVCDADAVIETAGALDQGQRVWAQAMIPELSRVIGKDVSHGGLLITNSHDGTGALRILPTETRVVCNNTLTGALSRAVCPKGRQNTEGDIVGGFRVTHTKSMNAGVQQVADQYAAAIAGWHAQSEALAQLASVPSDQSSLAHIMNAAFRITPDALKDEGARAAKIRSDRTDSIVRIRHSPTCNVEGTAGTVYADLMAVTEWLDHEWKRGPAAALMDAGQIIKADAMEAALSLV
jgi:phage/plasmid-like protein (TIGR03299 family)